jgi:hypothetical protein
MRTTIFAAATALALSAAPAFAAGGYAFQTDPLPVQAGEHVAGNRTWMANGQAPNGWMVSRGCRSTPCVAKTSAPICGPRHRATATNQLSRNAVTQ